MTRNRNKAAFTLIELLVVISIIAVLMSIMLPAMRKVRGMAKNVVCKSNVRQIGFAFNMYIDGQDKKEFPTRWNAYDPIQHPMQVVLYKDLGEDHGAFKCPSAVKPQEGFWTDDNETPYFTSYGYNTLLGGVSLMKIEHPARKIIMADTMMNLESANPREASDLNLWGPAWKPAFGSSVIADWHDGEGNVLFADFSVSGHEYEEQFEDGELYDGWWPLGKR